MRLVKKGRRCGALAPVAAALTIAGCAGDRPPPTNTGEPAPLEALERSAVVYPGRNIVIPISPRPGSDPSGRLVEARLGESRVSASIHRFDIQAAPDRRWLASTRVWTTPDQREAARDGAAAPIDLLVLPPSEDAQGDLLFEGVRVRLDWRDAPRLDPAPLFRLSPVPVELNTPVGQSALFRAVAPARDDPTQRWRTRLLADRLRIAGFDILATRLDDHAFESEPLESIATLLELRWRTGLAWLAETDPVLASDVATALTRIATVNGVVRPAWTPSVVVGRAGGVDQLLSDLLNNQLSVAARLARVDAWLMTQPRAMAWIVDDAGLANPGAGLALSRAGVVDLAGRGGIARAALNPDRPGPGVTIAPLGSAVVVASDTLPRGSGAMTVSLGDWSIDLSVAAGALIARPPGLRLAPFYAPWTLATWLTGSPAAPPADLATAALLTRRPDGAWELRIECRTPDGAAPAGDVVRVFFGSSRQARSVLRLDGRGFMIDELAPVDEDESPTRLPLAVRRNHDRWSCVIDVPSDVIESGSLVRLGMERRLASGFRALWPRPALPEHDQPGRALVDLGDWFGMATPTAR